MANLKELRNVRIQKLHDLRKLGVDPYPAKSSRSILTSQILNNFPEHEGKKATVAGRIMAFRKHGQLAFLDVKDSSGSIQLYIKAENLTNPNHKYSELGFDELHFLDVGDFVEGHGVVAKTKSGEISVEISNIRLLTKSLRPLPDKWEGLKDKETRLRKRYLDTNINPEVYQRFIRRAKFWEAHRDFFKKNNFLEINIPVLENIPGGADAKPFVTHMDAIDQDFYLRISHELFLKRLIGGGYEKVYEIGPRFRNEGLSDEHLPEHMAMEFYWAYADWKEGMEFIKNLFNHIINYVYEGKHQFSIRGHSVDFSKGWEVLDFAHIMKEKYGINVHNTTVEEVEQLLKEHKVKGNFDKNITRGIDNLWKNIRKDISGPAFLINHPKFISPLSKSKIDEPHITERFQPIIAGSELGNGWSELNDPLDQLERFMEQQALRDAGDDEAQWLDIDYVEMLEYGMPPTFGYGHSERVFWFLEDVSAREGVPFPQLKHEIDPSTKEIYGRDFSVLNSQNTVSPTKQISEESSESVALPSREHAHSLLEKYVKEPYQILHARMVAEALEKYAEKFGLNTELWYLTGLLHDLDYFEFPDEHPKKSLEWFKEWDLPADLIHAVAAHAHDRTGEEPQTKLAAALIAVDELAGLLYAYSLMRPEGFTNMEVGSAKKKFKDKAFAAKVSRDEILFGLDKFGEDFDSHINFLIKVFEKMNEFKK